MLIKEEEKQKLEQLEKELKLHESIRETLESEEDKHNWICKESSLLSNIQTLKLKEADLIENHLLGGIPIIGLKGMNPLED